MPFLKSILTIVVAAGGALSLTAFYQHKGQEKQRIAVEMKYSMVNKLLKPWYPLAVDKEDGGFLSSFSFDFKPVGNQDKMIVTQARHVWSNAKAAELYPDVSYYRGRCGTWFPFFKG